MFSLLVQTPPASPRFSFRRFYDDPVASLGKTWRLVARPWAKGSGR